MYFPPPPPPQGTPTPQQFPPPPHHTQFRQDEQHISECARHSSLVDPCTSYIPSPSSFHSQEQLHNDPSLDGSSVSEVAKDRRNEKENFNDPLRPNTAPLNGSASTNIAQDTVGTFNGGSYRISHRSTNSILTVNLAIGCPIKAKPGAMVAMSPSVTLTGSFKPSLKGILAGTSMSYSTFTGPGEVVLAPANLGDTVAIPLTGSEEWRLGKDAFLACTQGVNKEFQRQAISQTFFSGEGLWTYRIGGVGVLWISSFGAIIKKELRSDEKYIVDNRHLIAWTCNYVTERVDAGFVSALGSREGLVCKFSGPGFIFYQTRNAMAFKAALKMRPGDE